MTATTWVLLENIKKDKKIQVRPKKREEKIRWNLGKDGRHRRKYNGSSIYVPTEFE